MWVTGLCSLDSLRCFTRPHLRELRLLAFESGISSASLRRAPPALRILLRLVPLGYGPERLQPLHSARHYLAPRLLGAHRIRVRPPLFYSQTSRVHSPGNFWLRGDLPRHARPLHPSNALEIFAKKAEGRPDHIGTPFDFSRDCLNPLLFRSPPGVYRSRRQLDDDFSWFGQQ